MQDVDERDDDSQPRLARSQHSGTQRLKPVSVPTLSLSELDTELGRWITGDSHHRCHAETGAAPVARWLGTGWLPRMTESLEQLDLLLLTVAAPRKVPRDGIRCHGLRYLT